MRRTILLAALALLAAAPARAFIAENGLVVSETGRGDFAVGYRGRQGASDFWCAAGDYVLRGLRLPPGTPIFRTSSPPRRAGEGVRFSLSSQGASATGLLLWSGGLSVSASHARMLCDRGVGLEE